MKKNFLLLLMALLPMMSWAQTAITSVEVKDFTYQGDLTWIEVRKHVFINGVAAESGYNLSYKDEQGNDIAEADLHDAGFYTVTITGTGTYTGSKTADKTFEVRQAGLTVNILKAEQEYSQIPIVKYSLYGDFKSGDTEDNVAIAFTILEAGDPDHFYNASDDPYPIYDPKTTHITATSKNYIIGVNVASNALLTVTGLKIDDIVFTADAVTYNGNVQTPGIKADDMTLGTDYVVDYTNPESKDANTYTAKVTGINNFSGTKDVNYTIAPLTITDINIADITEEFIFANDEKKPTTLTVTSKEGALPMVLDQDFTVVYLDNINAGVATAKAEVTVNKSGGNFTFEAENLKKTATFTIKQRSIVNEDGSLAEADGFTASGFGPKNYKGAAWEITPNITYTPKGALTNGVDYDLAYANNINVSYDEEGKVAEAAEVTVKAKGNFTGEYVHTFKINPKNIANIPDADIVLNDGKAIKYQAKELTPSVAITDNAVPAEKQTLAEGEDKDYVVAYANNINVTTTESKATVTIAGKGNYKGTKVIEFEIGKAILRIVPVAGQYKRLGGSDPKTSAKYAGESLDAPAEVYYWDFATVDDVYYGLQGADAGKEKEILSVMPTLTRDAGEDINYYEMHVTNLASITAENYEIDAAWEATRDVVNYQIKPCIVFVKVKESLKEEYGLKVPAVAETEAFFEVNGLLTPDVIKTVTFTLKDENGEDLATPLVGGETIPVGKYTVDITAATAENNDRYEFELTDGLLEVTQRELTITADNKTVNYGEVAVLTATYTNFVPGEGVDNLNGELKISREKGDAVGEYAITIDEDSYTEANNPNYTFKYEGGKYIINALISDLVLDRVPKNVYTDETLNAARNTAAELIRSHNGATVNKVEFKMYTYNTATDVETPVAMKAEKWYSLILPFETSPREISKAFDRYVVVDTLSGKTSTDFAKFKTVIGKIPANTPFIVKLDEALANIAAVEFTDKKIVDPKNLDDENNPYVEIDGIRFIGTYKGKNGLTSDEQFFTFNTDDANDNDYFDGNSNIFIRPLGAYLQPQPGVEVRGIEIEEGDGSITAIEAVEEVVNNANSLYTIDGKKVLKAIQKGVYIQNGKKVILK